MNQRQPTSPTGAHELLRTKLAPPRLHATLVPRLSLQASLAEAVERKLTLLSAPAGFGKTTLVSQWSAQASSGSIASSALSTPYLSAWLSLDANDNDPVRFWRYLIAACQRFAPEIGQAALKLLQTAARPAWEHVLTGLLNDLAEHTGDPKQAVLVVEDYHLITAAQVHETLTFFLDHLPPACHLIITTRQDPPLPLAQWRASNELSELRASDLRFSRAETQAFFQQAIPLPVAPAAITYLAERTEGWVAGLHLATLALQKRPEPQFMGQFLATFRGTHEHIFTYLVAEVLHAAPAERQIFLLQTSMLSRLCSDLCNAVTNRKDSELVLEALEQANLFWFHSQTTKDKGQKQRMV